MDIRYSGKHLAITDGMKDHLAAKLAKVEKYFPRLIEAHVVLKKEKVMCFAEITLLGKNLRVFGVGREKENIFTAIDQATDRILKQAKKFREKVKDHRKSGRRPAKAEIFSPAGEIEPETAKSAGEETDIVPMKPYTVKPMPPEEASAQLMLSGKPFLIFMNSKSQRLNVIFRREDGRHGLIQPEF
jgi:putative sigma-54 modulation protein